MKKLLAFLFLLLSIGGSLPAQSDINSYSFKQGEVLDILLLSTKNNSKNSTINTKSIIKEIECLDEEILQLQKHLMKALINEN